MCRMLNLTLCLLEWSYIVYLISIFSFDNNYVPQLVENSSIREDASEQYLVRGGKDLEIKVSI